MKTTLLSFALLIALFSLKAEKANAQVTGISLSAYGYATSYCLLPAPYEIHVSGTLTGTVPVDDSTIININWGDGSDTSFKVMDTAGGTFSFYDGHVYSAKGTYKPIITATDADGGATATDTLADFSISDTCGITAISLSPIRDTFYESHCILPSPFGIVVFGNLTGTVSPGDSTEIYINWGDGSDTTVYCRDDSAGGTEGYLYPYFDTAINHTYSVAGVYAPVLIATDAAGGVTATKTFPAFSISDSCGTTAVKTIMNTTKISVYPNPANEQIFITANNNRAFTVNVTDMTGRSMYFQNSDNGKAAISTTAIPAGVYFIKINVADGSEQTIKVVVMH